MTKEEIYNILKNYTSEYPSKFSNSGIINVFTPEKVIDLAIFMYNKGVQDSYDNVKMKQKRVYMNSSNNFFVSEVGINKKSISKLRIK